MQKVLGLAGAIALVLAASAQAQTRLEAAFQFAESAFWVIDEHGDWESGARLLEAAIDASDSQCWDGLYGDYLVVVREAQQMRRSGQSDRAVQQWYQGRVLEVEGDCEGESGQY